MYFFDTRDALILNLAWLMVFECVNWIQELQQHFAVKCCLSNRLDSISQKSLIKFFGSLHIAKGIHQEIQSEAVFVSFYLYFQFKHSFQYALNHNIIKSHLNNKLYTKIREQFQSSVTIVITIIIIVVVVSLFMSSNKFITFRYSQPLAWLCLCLWLCRCLCLCLLDELLDWSAALVDVVDEAKGSHAHAATQARPVHNVQCFQRIDELLFEELHHFAIQLNTL